MSKNTIIESDWLAFMHSLKKGSVDLILTDPPYCISRATGFANVSKGESRFAVKMDFGKWDREEINLPEFALECYRVLPKGGTVIIWYDIWKLERLEKALRDAGFKMLRQIIWQKTNPVPLNSKRLYLTNSREMAVVAVKIGTPTFHAEYDKGVYELPIPRHGGKRVHPTQKPVDLFEQLVAKHSNAGHVVIDPFLGSGTTAVAAFRQNRTFMGCDIDPNYVRAANNRVREEML